MKMCRRTMNDGHRAITKGHHEYIVHTPPKRNKTPDSTLTLTLIHNKIKRTSLIHFGRLYNLTFYLCFGQNVFHGSIQTHVDGNIMIYTCTCILSRL